MFAAVLTIQEALYTVYVAPNMNVTTIQSLLIQNNDKNHALKMC